VSAIPNVGQPAGFERTQPLNQPEDIAQKREDTAVANKEDLQALSAQHEQVKAPVDKGQGTMLDIEV